MNNNRIQAIGDEFNIFLAIFFIEKCVKNHTKNTQQYVCAYVCGSVCLLACLIVLLCVLYLPQVLHAAMYAIKMNAQVFCQPPRTRPCLMRYNPLEAGILLSLFPAP